MRGESPSAQGPAARWGLNAEDPFFYLFYGLSPHSWSYFGQQWSPWWLLWADGDSIYADNELYQQYWNEYGERWPDTTSDLWWRDGCDVVEPKCTLLPLSYVGGLETEVALLGSGQARFGFEHLLQPIEHVNQGCFSLPMISRLSTDPTFDAGVVMSIWYP